MCKARRRPCGDLCGGSCGCTWLVVPGSEIARRLRNGLFQLPRCTSVTRNPAVGEGRHRPAAYPSARSRARTCASKLVGICLTPR